MELGEEKIGSRARERYSPDCSCLLSLCECGCVLRGQLLEGVIVMSYVACPSTFRESEDGEAFL